MSHLDVINGVFNRGEQAYAALAARTEGALPADLREHFNRDLPALASLAKRLVAELAAAEGMLEVSLSGEVNEVREENVRLAATLDRYRRIARQLRVDLDAIEDEPAAESAGRCPKCRSAQWVPVSLDGGHTRRRQCVPCGAIRPGVIDDSQGGDAR